MPPTRPIPLASLSGSALGRMLRAMERSCCQTSEPGDCDKKGALCPHHEEEDEEWCDMVLGTSDPDEARRRWGEELLRWRPLIYQDPDLPPAEAALDRDHRVALLEERRRQGLSLFHPGDSIEAAKMLEQAAYTVGPDGRIVLISDSEESRPPCRPKRTRRKRQPNGEPNCDSTSE